MLEAFLRHFLTSFQHLCPQCSRSRLERVADQISRINLVGMSAKSSYHTFGLRDPSSRRSIWKGGRTPPSRHKIHSRLSFPTQHRPDWPARAQTALHQRSVMTAILFILCRCGLVFSSIPTRWATFTSRSGIWSVPEAAGRHPVESS